MQSKIDIISLQRKETSVKQCNYLKSKCLTKCDLICKIMSNSYYKEEI
ncbi:DUF4033 domain-containing protein [Staphylococcus aureus]|nr:DUF4033 domain-containing protein [Staphylococcus aureus]